MPIPIPLSIFHAIRASKSQVQAPTDALFNLLQIVTALFYPRLVSSHLSSRDVRGSVKKYILAFPSVQTFRIVD
jgi:hypothetical protein